MSIANNLEEFDAARNKARIKYPPMKLYPRKPCDCRHDFSFIIFCDGGDWDIARCRYCGLEKVIPCTFDDDYD